MKVVLLAAGAASMYCGSCLRDNRLAATLRELGRDVLLMPLYTPIRTDESDVSDRRVRMGGVGAFLAQSSRLFRSLPRFMTRWLDHPILLRGVGRLAAKTDARALGELTLSILRGEHGVQSALLDELVSDLERLRPAVVNLPNLLLTGIASALRRRSDTAIVCTLSGEDLFIDGLPESARRGVLDLIRENAAAIDGFLATSRYFADFAVREYSLPEERVCAVPMGVRVEDFDDRRTPGDVPTIGYFARICPAKGLLELARAFAALRQAGVACRLAAAGYLAAGDRAYLGEVQDFLRERSLLGEFSYAGELTRADKARFLSSVDVFCVPTVWPEAKGLYVLEALASGAAAVLPAHGSFPELIDATGGGLLFDPRRPDDLVEKLQRLICDAPLRSMLAVRGREGVRARHTDRHMAEETWAAYLRIVARVRGAS